jgi:hypothetical protein
MTSVDRIFNRGRVWFVAYYPERLAKTQLGHLTRSMFDRCYIVSDADLVGAQ